MKATERLQQHIDKHYAGSASRFAREHRFDVSELTRILRGERGKNMTVRTALKIERACAGRRPEVPIKLWAEV